MSAFHIDIVITLLQNLELLQMEKKKKTITFLASPWCHSQRLRQKIEFKDYGMIADDNLADALIVF